MIDTIVLDLDGTLWQTKEAYVYAYQELAKLYLTGENIDYKAVLNSLGDRLEVLLAKFLPGVNDPKLPELALNLATTHLLNNPDNLLFNGIKELITTLSKSYKLYLITEGFPPLVEAFFTISKTRACFQNYYTLLDGSKKENLAKISTLTTGKLLYLGDAEIDYLSITNHQKIFFIYAAYGYKDCPIYDYKISYPLEFFEKLELINKKDRMIGNHPYEIISVGDAHLTVIYKEKYNFFGFLELTKTKADDLLLTKLTKIPNLLGPFNGNTWYEYRLALNEFDFKLYPDISNSSYEVSLLLRHGFTISHKYISTLASFNERLAQRALAVKLDKDYTYRIYQGQACYQKLEEIYEIALDAFKDATYYEPISKTDFLELYIKSLALCNPDLVIIYYNQEPVAFSFGYADLENRFYVSKTTAIKEKFQNKKLILKLIALSYKRILELGYKEILFHFQNAKTRTLMNVHKGKIIRQKEYGIFKHE